MRPPVRVVCGQCLQSLECSAEDGPSSRAICPHCQASVELDRGSDPPTGEVVTSHSPIEFGNIPTPPVDVRPETSGDRIGRFQLREPLGEGGYGQVYRAYDPHLDREVALKVLKPNRLGEKAIERFYREARAAARLDHPNIVGLHDAGREEGRCWIAYQLVTGRTLSSVRDSERPSIDRSVGIVRELALALHHAHGRGVYHRDIKPANVLIDDSGRARLTDFGLARRHDIDSDLTREGTILGTPHYMSPEAAAGRAHEADARSDVYSLGVILYELICGRRPSDQPSGAPLWRSTLVMAPPTPRSVDRDIPLSLDRICMKALAFHPAERFPDGSSFAEALADYLQKRPARAAIARPNRSRARLIAGLAAGVAAIALLGTILVHQSARPAGPSAARGLTEVPPMPDLTESSKPMNLAPAAEPIDHQLATPKSLDRAHPPSPAAFVGSDKRYHRPSCQHTPIKKPVFFESADRAEAAGLKPCRTCKPDQARPPDPETQAH